jgi:antirestriction protein
MNEVIEKIEPRIYVGTYEKYNNGSIAGKWLDLNDYEDINAFYKACKKLHKDESDPELMFQDWEYIPDSMIGESWLSDEFFNFLDVVNGSSFDIDVYISAINDGIDWESLEDYYMGEFDNDEDFTIEMLGEPEIEHFAHYYINWARCARDYMMDFFEIDGHYFSNQ